MCSQQWWSSYLKKSWTYEHMCIWRLGHFGRPPSSFLCTVGLIFPGVTLKLSLKRNHPEQGTPLCPKMAIIKKWILESKRVPTHMVPEPLHMCVSIRFKLQKTKRNPTEIKNWHEKEWTQSFFFKLSCQTFYLQIFLTIVVFFGHKGWNC